MAAGRPAWSVLLAAILVLGSPTGQALSLDGLFEATLRSERPVDLEGNVTLASMGGVVDLSRAADEGLRLDLRWGHGLLHREEWWGTQTFTAGTPAHASGPVHRDTTEIPGGTLVATHCSPGCAMLAIVGPETPLLANGTIRGPLAWSDEATQRGIGPRQLAAGPAGLGPQREHPPGTLWLGAAPAGSAGELQLRSVSTAGSLRLVLWNVTLEVATDEGSRVYRSGYVVPAAAAGSAPLPLDLAPEQNARVLEIEFMDATFVAHDAPRVAVLVPSLEMEMDGRLLVHAASGEVRLPNGTHPVRDEELSAQGLLRLRVEHVAPAMPTVGGALGRGALDISMHGDATKVAVGPRVLLDDPWPRGPVVAAGAAALLLALALRVALLLHTRLDPQRLLDHPKRRELWRMVEDEPGIQLHALCERTGYARSVVCHHLRMLERHRIVRIVRRGRTWHVSSGSGDPAPPALLGRALLGQGVRRRIADALLAAESPLTQQEIGKALSAHQQLVSYHLRRMQAEELVALRESRPNRYEATQLLRRLEHLR